MPNQALPKQTFIDKLLEKNLLPDFLIRFQMIRLLKKRLYEIKNSDQNAFIQSLKNAPIALCVDAANEQHYEVPTSFFKKVLGPRLKYSCGFFENTLDTLANAEEKMLALTCERAGVIDGQEILELGCGWGSLTLWIAEKYPNSKILGVSNSHSQREFILFQAKERKLKNIKILTQDMNQFQIPHTFDRVISIEMFEHMRNIPALLSRIAGWLNDNGKLFVHIFSHHRFSYFFEEKDASDWMARHFFTGGMMPSHSLYQAFHKDLLIEKNWTIPGHHYAKTAETWLSNMDQDKKGILKIFKETYGAKNALKWWVRWRVFFMACAELWGFEEGKQWQVSHYLFCKTKQKAFS